MAEPLLRVDGVSKRFGGLLAVDNVSLGVEAGRITALIGPNGAGKTTLFAMISGFLTPSSGRIHHRGEDITGVPPYRLARRGIARTFQIVRPFAGLTVHENIAIGAHLSRRSRAAARDAAAQVAQLGRSRRIAGQARREPHGRGAKAAGACPRAGDGARPAAARRSLGRAQSIRARRHGADDPRHRRPRHHHCDDRARHAGGDESRRNTSTCWRKAASSPKARRKPWSAMRA